MIEAGKGALHEIVYIAHTRHACYLVSPDVVRFVEPEQISETAPKGYVPVKDGFDEVRNHVKSLYKNDPQTK